MVALIILGNRSALFEMADIESPDILRVKCNTNETS